MICNSSPNSGLYPVKHKPFQLSACSKPRNGLQESHDCLKIDKLSGIIEILCISRHWGLRFIKECEFIHPQTLIMHGSLCILSST